MDTGSAKSRSAFRNGETNGSHEYECRRREGALPLDVLDIGAKICRVVDLIFKELQERVKKSARLDSGKAHKIGCSMDQSSA